MEKPQRSWWIRIIKWEIPIKSSKYFLASPAIINIQNVSKHIRKKKKDDKFHKRNLVKIQHRQLKNKSLKTMLSEVAGCVITNNISGNPSDFYHHPTSHIQNTYTNLKKIQFN